MMKRAGNLFPKLIERDNLRLAVYKALKGKRDRSEAQQFLRHLDRRVDEMAGQIADGSFPVGRYHQFVIYDPKERVITAPCFAERVLHHAVMNVCEPVLDRWLIDDTFACRKGKGRLAALERAQQFARRFPFFLKLDVRKYFDSVAHDYLLERLTLRFKDRHVLELFERIVRSFRGQLGRGLPIGSLTSQHFANFYLGWLDRFVKENLQIKGYVRYMDDVSLWAESKKELKQALEQSADFLQRELSLTWKPPFLNRTAHSMDFLGCRVFSQHVILNRRSRRRFRRRLVDLERLHDHGEITEQECQYRATALVAFTRQRGLSSWRFRCNVLQRLSGSGSRARTG